MKESGEIFSVDMDILPDAVDSTAVTNQLRMLFQSLFQEFTGKLNDARPLQFRVRLHNRKGILEAMYRLLPTEEMVRNGK